MSKVQESIFDLIRTERYRQDQKWGERNYSIFYWICVLVEEVGEASKAAIEFDIPKMKEELIHVAAVVVSFLECLERNKNAVCPGASHYCPDNPEEEKDI